MKRKIALAIFTAMLIGASPVMAENVEYETATICENVNADELVRKKAGDPHRLDDRELRRTYGYLARKGFSSSVIWGAIQRYQEEAAGED